MGNQKNNETIRIVKGSERFAGSPDDDMVLPLQLTQSEQQKIEGDRTTLLNIEERFNHERQISTKFRLVGKITHIFDNSITGKTSYTPFTNTLSYTNAIDIKTNPQPPSSADWHGYPSYDEFTFFRTKGIQNHVDYLPKSAGTYNWSVYVTYPSSNDDNQQMEYTDDEFQTVNNFVVSDGIPYVVKNRVENGKKLISLYCGYKHNVNPGEWVYLKNPVDGKHIFEVYSIGDNAYGNEDKVLNIFDFGYTGTGFNNQVTGNLKRIISLNNTGETMSRYYVRKHAILTEPKNVDLHKMGFENNPFKKVQKLEYSALTPNNEQRISTINGNQTFGFSVDRDIDIIGITDNQGRPISELFVTIINKGYMGWFNRPWNNSSSSALEVGWDFNFKNSVMDSWWYKDNLKNKDNIPYNNYQINNIDFYYNRDLQIGDEIKGDICEWNDYDQKEVMLSKISHKISFNTNIILGTTEGNASKPLGYSYNPHYSIPIRGISDYIETGQQDKVDDIPDYSFYSKNNGEWRWRDFYQYGYIDTNGNGVNHPFLNNRHYPFSNIIFLLSPITKNNNVFNDIIFSPIIDNCE